VEGSPVQQQAPQAQILSRLYCNGKRLGMTMPKKGITGTTGIRMGETVKRGEVVKKGRAGGQVSF